MFNTCLEESQKNSTINSDSEIKYSKIENFEPLNKDSLNNIKMRNGIVVNNESELLNAIRTSLDNKLIKNNYSFGAIPKNTIERLIKDLGNSINFKNGQYAFVFSSDDIKHISKHFSNENEIASALINLYDTVVNYDNVDIEKNGSQTRLIFKKSYINADYLSVEIISNKKRAFDLVTYYITKKIAEHKIIPLPTPRNLVNWLHREFRLPLITVYPIQMKLSSLRLKRIARVTNYLLMLTSSAKKTILS